MADNLATLYLLSPVRLPVAAYAQIPYSGGPVYGPAPIVAPAPAYAAIAADPLPDAPAIITGAHFLFDFYFRIWIVPSRIDLRNPTQGVDIPFAIWNAYPYSNDLVEISSSGAESLTLDIAPVSTFYPIEYRTANVQIDEGTTGNILALLNFIFEQGEALFTFSVVNASVVPIIPEVPVEEVLEWLTDVQVSNNGTEQRISLRGNPRRSTSNTMIAVDSGTLKEKLDQCFKDLAEPIFVPYFQYATPAKTAMLVSEGDTVVEFDSARTDLRAGDFALLFRKDEQFVLSKFISVTPTGGTLESPITLDIPKGSMVVPLYRSLVNNGYSVKRYGVNNVAQFAFKSTVVPDGRSYADPNSEIEIAYYEGFPILEKRPFRDQMVEDKYDTGAVRFDYETTTISQVTHWDYSKHSCLRNWVLRRVQKPEDMQWWRAFLTLACGQQNPFLVPTWRDDLNIAEAPVSQATSLKLLGSRYSTLYDGAEAYKRWRLTTAAGEHHITVVSATPDDDGNDIIQFLPQLPSGEGWTEITMISFMLKMRLGDDKVTLKHYSLDTSLDLVLRVTDQ